MKNPKVGQYILLHFYWKYFARINCGLEKCIWTYSSPVIPNNLFQTTPVPSQHEASVLCTVGKLQLQPSQQSPLVNVGSEKTACKNICPNPFCILLLSQNTITYHIILEVNDSFHLSDQEWAESYTSHLAGQFQPTGDLKTSLSLFIMEFQAWQFISQTPFPPGRNLEYLFI